MPDIDTPHFDYPFHLSGSSFAAVEQDTLDDIYNAVAVILVTPVDTRPESPGFGSEDLTFKVLPLDIDGIAEHITSQDQRAAIAISEEPDRFDDLVENIVIEVSTRGV